MAGLVVVAGCSEAASPSSNAGAGSFIATGGTGGLTGGMGAAGGMTGGTGVVAGMTGGMGVVAGMTGGTGVTGGMGGGGGSGGTTGGTGGVAGMEPDGGMPDAGGDGDGDGMCCPTGDCICREEPPSSVEAAGADGPYNYESYDNGVGCIYYPTDAEPPFAAVALSDGFGGSGGCSALAQTSGWGPFYASHGIVAMIVRTTGGDSPSVRGRKLNGGIESFKEENADSASPIFGQLAGRYGTSGFSMGGGGTTYAATDDPTLLSSVGLMAWTPVGQGVTVPTLFICGASDNLAVCGGHSEPAYGSMPDTTDKMLLNVSAGHVGQPSAGGDMSGANALVFQKVYLEGDERWRDLLLSMEYDSTNIE